ncbi:unnamed protein product [Oppiella nova]|uniref:Uncharacterized protein n=1 Tax=Oppiella nova TaxID=334625 RepID=A0A7R9QWH4_9ACAR|nr:unnamed protein product [Oppiella nova]CAG2176907.1 unnamed protein product [Oppiella nova]
MGFQKGSPLRQTMDILLTYLKESGLIGNHPDRQSPRFEKQLIFSVPNIPDHFPFVSMGTAMGFPLRANNMETNGKGINIWENYSNSVAYGDVWEPYRWPLTESMRRSVAAVSGVPDGGANLLAGVPSDGQN